jgi:hypothetical protein
VDEASYESASFDGNQNWSVLRERSISVSNIFRGADISLLGMQQRLAPADNAPRLP